MDLTPEGRLVLDRARDLLAAEESLYHGLERLRGGLSGTLRVGVIPAAMPVAGLLIAPFHAAHPGVSVEIRSLSSQAIQGDLDSFDLDAGVTYLENEPLAHVIKHPLYFERYLLATAARGPLGERHKISWRSAAEQPLCLLSDDMQNRRILNAVFASIGVDVRPTITSNSFLAILSHLRSGDWSSIVPHTFAHLFGDQPGIALIPLTDPDHRQSVGLVTSARAPAPPMGAAIAAFAKSLEIEAQFDHSF